MKISKKSWLYKIRNFGNGWPVYNDNLCSLFWACVSRFVMILTLAAIIVLLVYSYFTSPFWISTSILLLFVFASTVLPLLAIDFIRKRLGHPVKWSKESLILEYLKAKKNKVCPMIEYVD